MDEPWRAWLAELAREGRLASAIPVAVRGYRWAMQVVVDGDFTGYQLVGRIKIAPDAPVNLAVMDALGPVYEAGQTYWEMSLPASGANSTSQLPNDATGEYVLKFPMMLTMVPPASGAPYHLIGGLFTVIGAV